MAIWVAGKIVAIWAAGRIWGEFMNLAVSDAVGFKKAIDAVSVLVDEAEFILSPEGLSLKASDPSQISMVEFSMPKSAFKQYSIKEKKKIGLDLNYLSQILSRAKAKDALEIELDEKSSRLSIKFSGSSSRHFSIPLIDISQSEIPTPKIEFDAELKLRAETISDGLKDAVLIAPHITLGVSDSCFYIRANSNKGNLNNETAKDEKKELVDFNVKAEASAMFPLEYLQSMLKASSSDTVVELSIKENSPVRLSYPVGDASVTYYLAPRIEG